jgi:hypothetical protein
LNDILSAGKRFVKSLVETQIMTKR